MISSEHGVGRTQFLIQWIKDYKEYNQSVNILYNQ